MPHERALANDAFQGRASTFGLEQGVFHMPYPDGHNYAFRMVFDQSPYPSPETWQLHGQTCAMDVAEWRELHSGDPGTYYDKTWLGNNNCSVMQLGQH